MRFASSLYLCFIWIRVLKFVFQNPKEAAKHLQSYPFFKKFVQGPSAESYIDGLCESLQSISIGSPVKRPGPKGRLSDTLFDEETVKTNLLHIRHQDYLLMIQKRIIFLKLQHYLLPKFQGNHLLLQRKKEKEKKSKKY